MKKLVVLVVLVCVSVSVFVIPVQAWGAERATVTYAGVVFPYDCYRAFGEVCSYGQVLSVRTDANRYGWGRVRLSGYGNPYHVNQRVWVVLSGNQIWAIW